MEFLDMASSSTSSSPVPPQALASEQSGVNGAVNDWSAPSSAVSCPAEVNKVDDDVHQSNNSEDPDSEIKTGVKRKAPWPAHDEREKKRRGLADGNAAQDRHCDDVPLTSTPNIQTCSHPAGLPRSTPLSLQSSRISEENKPHINVMEATGVAVRYSHRPQSHSEACLLRSRFSEVPLASAKREPSFFSAKHSSPSSPSQPLDLSCPKKSLFSSSSPKPSPPGSINPSTKPTFVMPSSRLVRPANDDMKESGGNLQEEIYKLKQDPVKQTLPPRPNNQSWYKSHNLGTVKQRRIKDEGLLRLPLDFGWRRETRFKSVEGRLQGEVAYFAPSGQKLCQSSHIKKYLVKNGLTELSLDNFSFRMKVKVSDFYEAREGSEGLQWRLLPEDEIDPLVRATDGRQHRGAKLAVQPRGGAPGVGQTSQPPNAGEKTSGDVSDAKLLCKQQAEGMNGAVNGWSAPSSAVKPVMSTSSCPAEVNKVDDDVHQSNNSKDPDSEIKTGVKRKAPWPAHDEREKKRRDLADGNAAQDRHCDDVPLTSTPNIQTCSHPAGLPRSTPLSLQSSRISEENKPHINVMEATGVAVRYSHRPQSHSEACLLRSRFSEVPLASAKHEPSFFSAKHSSPSSPSQPLDLSCPKKSLFSSSSPKPSPPGSINPSTKPTFVMPSSRLVRPANDDMKESGGNLQEEIYKLKQDPVKQTLPPRPNNQSWYKSHNLGTVKRRRIKDEGLLRLPLDFGWRRETRFKSVEGRLQGEVAYFAPSGQKLCRHYDVKKYLVKNGLTELSLDNFSFRMKVKVGDFYEAREGSEGLQWRLLPEDEIDPLVRATDGRQNRGAKLAVQPRGGAPGVGQTSQPPNAGEKTSGDVSDAKLLCKQQAEGMNGAVNGWSAPSSAVKPVMSTSSCPAEVNKVDDDVHQSNNSKDPDSEIKTGVKRKAPWPAHDEREKKRRDLADGNAAQDRHCDDVPLTSTPNIQTCSHPAGLPRSTPLSLQSSRISEENKPHINVMEATGVAVRYSHRPQSHSEACLLRSRFSEVPLASAKREPSFFSAKHSSPSSPSQPLDLSCPKKSLFSSSSPKPSPPGSINPSTKPTFVMPSSRLVRPVNDDMKESGGNLQEEIYKLKQDPVKQTLPPRPNNQSWYKSHNLGTVKQRRIKDEGLLRLPLDFGWRRETRFKSVEGRLQGEVAYFAPSGQKLCRHYDVKKYLVKNGLTELSLDNFSFRMKVKVSDFYEAREGSEGLQWRLLPEDEIDPLVRATDGRQNRGAKLAVQPRGGAPGVGQTSQPPNAGEKTSGDVSDAKLLCKQQAEEIAQQMKVMQILKQSMMEAAKEAKKQQALIAAGQHQIRMEQIKILKEREIELLQQLRMEKELHAQKIPKEKRKKKEAEAIAKATEAEKRKKERKSRQCEEFILMQQEEERHKQHMMLMTAAKAQKAEEDVPGSALGRPTNPLDVAVTRQAKLERDIKRSSEEDGAPGMGLCREAVGQVHSSAQHSLYVQEPVILSWYCQFCHRGDHEDLLLLCDGCERGCHTYCHTPKLFTIPEGDWLCPACTMKESGGGNRSTDTKPNAELISEEDASRLQQKWTNEFRKRKRDDSPSTSPDSAISCAKKAKTQDDQ